MRPVEAVLRKELLDHLRDRRALAAALGVPLLGPVLLAAALHLLAGWMGQQRPLVLSVEGADRAPGLVRFLERRGAEVVSDADVEQKVRGRRLDVALRVPPDYAERVVSGATARLQLVSDGARSQGLGAVRRTEKLLEEYAAALRAQRLRLRGVAAELAEPFEVDDFDVSTPEQQAGRLLNAVPLFLLLAAFLCTTQVALDAAAGERERGSLESLLLNPLSPAQVLVGKWLAALALGLVGTFITALATALLLSRVPLEELGLRVSVGPSAVVAALAVLLPLVGFTAALQLLLATWARSYKEAQTYVSLVLLLPTLPGVLLAMNPSEPSRWMSVIPAYGQQLLLLRWVRGEGMDPLALLLATVGAGVSTALCLAAGARLLRREGVVLGR